MSWADLGPNDWSSPPPPTRGDVWFAAAIATFVALVVYVLVVAT